MICKPTDSVDTTKLKIKKNLKDLQTCVNLVIDKLCKPTENVNARICKPSGFVNLTGFVNLSGFVNLIGCVNLTGFVNIQICKQKDSANL